PAKPGSRSHSSTFVEWVCTRGSACSLRCRYWGTRGSSRSGPRSTTTFQEGTLTSISRSRGLKLRLVGRRARPAAGVVRVDARTKTLLRRVQPGEIAIIDHEDLDRVAAEELVASGVSAVVNSASSIRGRYPNMGPLILVQAG